MGISVKEFCAYVGGFRTPATVAVYGVAARRFLADATSEVDGKTLIQPDAIVRYVGLCTARNLSSATIAAHVSGLRHLLEFAKMRGVEVPATMAPLHMPRVREQVAPTMSRDELAVYARLCREHAEPYRTLMLLLPLSGLRVSEAAGLRVADVTPAVQAGGYTIDVRPNDARTVKGVSDRRVVVLAEGTAMLDAYCLRVYPTLPGFRGSASAWMFPRADATPVKRRAVLAEFKKLGERMGRADLSPHAARHAHASLLDAAGWSTKQIALQLGHADLNTTAGYIRGSLEQRHALMAGVSVGGDWK